MLGWRKEDLTEENIFKYINQYDIFYYYIENFEDIGIRFCSELREDHDPSCVVNEHEGLLYYKDFGDGTTTNCIGYVKLLLGLDYPQALEQISVDFDLGLHINERTPFKDHKGEHYISKSPRIRKSPTIIQVRTRSWNRGIDKNYWKDRYGISCSTLREYQIYPVDRVWLNGRIFMVEGKKDPIYAYRFREYTYKIMRPFSDSLKWMSNTTKRDIQGLDQLPWIYNILVITKSMKDVLVLRGLGIPAVAPQSETEVITKKDMDHLRKRFKNIILLFDNDRTGIESSKKYQEVYPFIIPERIPYDLKCKDISEVVMYHGISRAKKLCKDLIISHNDELNI